MKYTKKFPIHPKPDKQFSGASIFAQGGQLPGDDEATIVGKYNKSVPGLKEQQEKERKALQEWVNKRDKNEPTVFDQVKDERDDAQYYLDQRTKEYNNQPVNKQGVATGQTDAMVGLDDPILNSLLLAPLAGQLGKAAINNAYRLNPWAFKPNPDMMYRGIGKEGMEDALQSGVFRAKPNVEPIMHGPFDMRKKFSRTYYSPKFNIADQYGKGFIAEVPKDATTFRPRYSKGKDWSQIADENIPIDKGKILKKDWIQRYKEVPQPIIKNTTSIKSSELPKDLEPYLSKKVIPMTKEEEVFNSFLSSQGQAKNTMKRTKRYDSNGKEIFAFGGFKYPNGGSFYDSSNINTSKPQVNTVPSSYTDQFSGNTSSAPPKNTGSNAGSYISAVSSAIPGIMAATEKDIPGTFEDNASRIDREYTSAKHTTEAVLTASTGPVGGVISGVWELGDAIGKPIKDKAEERDPNTGKIKDPKRAKASAIIGSFFNPLQALITRANYEGGMGDVTGDAYIDALNEGAVDNTTWSKDQGARNFSAFGGYKNKFPYGGNLKSEVTGQSYLKDQIDDFSGKNFKTHKDGGVNIDSSNQVEKDEIIYNDYVYSARLKNKDGIPFSTIARRLKNQIKEQHG